MSTLVLLRHGQSTWNRDNRFTGWMDVPLTSQGEREARLAARLLEDHGLVPDVVHTSVLTRCIRTVELALDELAASWTPSRRSWRLNERHYGALQGQNKKEAVAVHGADRVHEWRRSFDVPPPPLPVDDGHHPRLDARYAALPDDALPVAESLRDVLARVVPYWQDSIAADLAAGRVVLVVAHGNSLRALAMHLLGIPRNDIADLNIATGQPWRFDLDHGGRVREHAYLDPDAAAEASQAVSRETA